MAKQTYDWASIYAYFCEGHTVADGQRKFGFHADAWYKARSRGLVPATPVREHAIMLRYDWAAVQAYYEQGHTYRECRARFGFASDSWTRAVRRGDIRPRPQRWPIDKLLREGRCRKTIKNRLVETGLLSYRCSECGLHEWRGKKLSIQIDHINGDSTDHRIENLRMLCPNCHSQTDTFGAKNIKRSRVVQR